MKKPNNMKDGVYLLAIDPGNVQSGWVFVRLNGGGLPPEVVDKGITPNGELLPVVRQLTKLPHVYSVIEMIASYGMPVGATVFETCVWIGRFIQASKCPEDVTLMYRKEVKMHLCGTPRAKDGNIRQAIIDKFLPSGGGKLPQVGTKKKPGPLYGIHGDIWAALGVALTWEDCYIC